MGKSNQAFLFESLRFLPPANAKNPGKEPGFLRFAPEGCFRLVVRV
jgi:hypothetical protein